ncbi:MAG: right-handed parallel beta-helix repeat-containing protein, partial [Acidobacteria bacterium]|nr:right-handed parallel beta-helix repeat-containing protein [Acidobacteriota bacterium]
MHSYMILAALIGVLATAPAFAVDGVILIDQSLALAGSVTPGDTPGFPVTIDRPGSYRLSGNLTVPDADTTAIEITANNVTVDLNGFVVRGPTNCGFGRQQQSGDPPAPVASCGPTGSGRGVKAPARVNIAVLNGTVRGMGSIGLELGDRARIERVRIESNGDSGIVVSDFALIVGNSVGLNWNGILSSGFGNMIKGNTIYQNHLDGIRAFHHNLLLLGNSVSWNGGFG